MDGDRTQGQSTLSEVVAHVRRQDQGLAERQRELVELRARLYRREQELHEARAVLVLVSSSRMYRLLRVLGQWGWLDHRIRRALR